MRGSSSIEGAPLWLFLCGLAMFRALYIMFLLLVLLNRKCCFNGPGGTQYTDCSYIAFSNLFWVRILLLQWRIWPDLCGPWRQAHWISWAVVFSSFMENEHCQELMGGNRKSCCSSQRNHYCCGYTSSYFPGRKADDGVSNQSLGIRGNKCDMVRRRSNYLQQHCVLSEKSLCIILFPSAAR